MPYKVIGEGSFGCVIEPPLKCEKNKDIHDKDVNYEGKVSKVMTEEDSVKEMKEYTVINDIDGIDKYAITKPIQCNPNLTEDDKNIINQCDNEKFKSNETKLNILLLENGGIDLFNYLYYKNNFHSKSLKEKKYFLTSLINLLDGLIFFQINNLTHRDIKIENIVYNRTTKISKFIDFGYARTFDTLYEEAKNSTVEDININYTIPDNESLNFNKFKDITNIRNGENVVTKHKKLVTYVFKRADIYSLYIAFNDIFNKIEKYNLKNILEKFDAFKNKFINFFKEKVIYDEHEDPINFIPELITKYKELLIEYNYFLEPPPKRSLYNTAKSLSRFIPRLSRLPRLTRLTRSSMNKINSGGKPHTKRRQTKRRQTKRRQTKRRKTKRQEYEN